MNCEETKKVSAMIDGEFPNEERERLKSHIESCAECREAEQDFVFLRDQIRGLAIDEQTLAPKSTSFIKRTVSIPAPVFAISTLLIAGLFIGLLITRNDAPPDSARIDRSETRETRPSSLARFDKGGIAEIYKEPKR